MAMSLRTGAANPPQDSEADASVRTVSAPARIDLDSPFVRFELRHLTRAEEVAKRLLDIVVSLVALIITAPLMALIALLVRIDSPGPAVFRQIRVGRGNTHFRFYKFRTMYVDARERFPEHYTYDYGSTPVSTVYFKLADDPRLTRVGRWLRRTSFDELPNLFNVLKGEMSLVGPRPEIPEMLCHYQLEQLVKFEVKPGLTGNAQVSGRNILRFGETVARDLEYVARRSFWVDLRILVKTPLVVVRMLGAL